MCGRHGIFRRLVATAHTRNMTEWVKYGQRRQATVFCLPMRSGDDEVGQATARSLRIASGQKSI